MYWLRRLGLACLTSLCTVHLCNATTYDFTFSLNPYTASGTITTGAADGAGFDITGVSGTWSVDGGTTNFSITGLLPPGSCCGVPSNDNILFPNGPYLDFPGFTFSASNGDNIDIWFSSPWYGLTDATFAANGNVINGVAGSFTLSPVPGPALGAGLPGLIFAGSGLLGWWRRKRTNAAATLAA